MLEYFLRFDLIKISLKIFLFLLILGFLPLTSQGSGYNFLPSMDWVYDTRFALFFFSVFFVPFLLWFLLIYGPGNSISVPLRPLMFFIYLFFGCISATSFVVVSIPMAMALTSDHEVQLLYTVESTDTVRPTDSGRHTECIPRIEIRGMPFFFSDICRITFRNGQPPAPGTKIAVTGRGTDLGVFVRNIQFLK